MRRRRLIQALLSAGLLMVLMILTTPKTYADNCGSLNDCFQTQGTAALVIVGIAVLIAITVLALPSLLDATKSPVPAEPPPEPPSVPLPVDHPKHRQRHDDVDTPPEPEVPEPVVSLIQGIHHVTAIAGNPQQNINFYASLLGLRLVKLTVNFDYPNTYHLYYGDELGRPGTVLSFFAWPGAPRGSRGSGQAVAVSFSIPEGALNYWGNYLTRRGIKVVQPPARFDEQMLSFYDPDGLQIDMVAHRATDMRAAWSGGPIPAAYAIRGIYGITLLEASYERTNAFLIEVLRFRQVKAGGNRFRYEVGDGGPGALLDVLSFPNIPPSQVTVGTIHHLAWRASGDEQQLALQQRLTSEGFNLTQGIDRLYFPSYSFREPGGVLFEIAMDGPGFTIDEPPEGLGTHLVLPSWLEPRRSELEEVLPPLRLPPIGR